MEEYQIQNASIQVEESGNITLAGIIDFDNAEEVDGKIQDIILRKCGQNFTFTIDLRELELSNTVIIALMLTWKRLTLAQGGATLSFANIPEKLRETITFSRVLDLFH